MLGLFSFITLELSKYTDSAVLARQSEGYLNVTNNINYRDNDIVETIVVLEDEPLITTYNEKKYDNISDYIASEKGKKISAKLIEKQNDIIQDIKNKNIDIDLSNSYNYTVVMNAVSMKTKVKNLDKIASIDGVKDVIVSNYYEAFEVEGENKELEEVSYTDVFMDSDKAWELGYTGEGMAIAVIDTGTDITHEAFMGDIENPKYTKESLNEIFSNVGLSAKGVQNADAVYHSEKIPYSFDYAGNDSHAYQSGLDHGTHVAGIVGANSGEIRGVAVDAQIIVMKVFDDNGNILIKGVSQWVLIGLERLRPLIVQNIFDCSKIELEESMEIPLDKIGSVESYNFEEMKDLRYDDVDVNHHINNAIYISLCEDALFENLKQEFDVSEISVDFKKSAVLSDKKVLVKSLFIDKNCDFTIAKDDSSVDFARINIKLKP